ncbi:DMT family transporter [soil metagenome]
MLLALLAGVALPLQAAVNSAFAARVTILWSAAISATVTAITLALAAVFIMRIAPPRLSELAALPPWLLCGGFFGVIVLGAMSSVPQRIGAAAMIACLIAGQTICGLLLDHFGVLGLPQQEITFGRFAGMSAIGVGVMMVRFL